MVTLGAAENIYAVGLFRDLMVEMLIALRG